MNDKVTISDIARAAGVSNSAVSYALNNKSGVSQRTRVKVLRLAKERGWRPNYAAQALSNASSRAVGLIVTYGEGVLAVESYALELISSLGSILEKEGYSLLLRSARSMRHELDIMREWIADGTVDALLVMNVEINDPRVDELKRHPGFPALLLCDASVAEGLTVLADDEEGAARDIIEYCHGLGHTYIARVAGPEMMGHTYVRDKAFWGVAMELGMRYSCLHTDYSPEQGRDSVRLLLSLPEAPTMIVCDSDATALAAVRVAQDRGLRVPEDLSVISWDDSFMCAVNTPGVTSLNRDVMARGRKAARMIVDMLSGREVESAMGAGDRLIIRASTGPLKRL